MKVIYNDELYGEVTYSRTKEAWRRNTPLTVPFNNKSWDLKFYIKLNMYLETKYGIFKDIGMDFFRKEDVERYELWDLEQRELYKKYLIEPAEIMKRIEDEIVADFYEQRENDLNDESCMEYFDSKTAKKIIGADSREKILALVKLKDVTILHNRIRFLGRCAWYPDFGIKVRSDGVILVGLEENMY